MSRVAGAWYFPIQVYPCMRWISNNCPNRCLLLSGGLSLSGADFRQGMNERFLQRQIAILNLDLIPGSVDGWNPVAKTLPVLPRVAALLIDFSDASGFSAR